MTESADAETLRLFGKLYWAVTRLVFMVSLFATATVGSLWDANLAFWILASFSVGALAVLGGSCWMFRHLLKLEQAEAAAR